MKKFLLLSFAGFSLLTTGCGFQEYVHTTEPRSTIYIGQTAADVYENFGVPTKKEILSENEQVLTYHKQEIEKDWSYRYFHECELKFYMKDDRLVDWVKRGDICAVKELSSDRERPYFNMTADGNISYGDHREVNGYMLPADAFKYNEESDSHTSFFSGWFSDDLEREFPDFSEQAQLSGPEGKNRVFIGGGVPTLDEYQQSDMSPMRIPADAF